MFLTKIKLSHCSLAQSGSREWYKNRNLLFLSWLRVCILRMWTVGNYYRVINADFSEERLEGLNKCLCLPVQGALPCLCSVLYCRESCCQAPCLLDCGNVCIIKDIDEILEGRSCREKLGLPVLYLCEPVALLWLLATPHSVCDYSCSWQLCLDLASFSKHSDLFAFLVLVWFWFATVLCFIVCTWLHQSSVT